MIEQILSLYLNVNSFSKKAAKQSSLKQCRYMCGTQLPQMMKLVFLAWSLNPDGVRDNSSLSSFYKHMHTFAFVAIHFGIEIWLSFYFHNAIFKRQCFPFGGTLKIIFHSKRRCRQLFNVSNLPYCEITKIFKPMKHCWYLWVSVWNPGNIHDLCLVLSDFTARDFIMAYGIK